MLRLALIGCGAHCASAHAPALAHYAAQHPGAIDLVAACDSDIARAERFCRSYGFGCAHADLEEMRSATKPDAVVAIVPVDKVCEIGGNLLRRDLPCVLEKPPGVTLAGAVALTEIARPTGTPHMVSLNRRFNPFLNRALDWARQAGPLRYVQARMLRHARREQEFLWGTGVKELHAEQK